jgi:antitoxin (DNA-binding transcriptional repressor) of toxin-antitoxin stability system
MDPGGSDTGTVTAMEHGVVVARLTAMEHGVVVARLTAMEHGVVVARLTAMERGLAVGEVDRDGTSAWSGRAVAGLLVELHWLASQKISILLCATSVSLCLCGYLLVSND